MGKKICSVCKEMFEDKYFDNKQEKCFLHCDKDNWYRKYKSNFTIWNIVYIKLFWSLIQKDLNIIYTNDLDPVGKVVYEKVIFPKFEKEYKYNFFESNDYDMGTNFFSYGGYHFYHQAPTQEVNSVINNLHIFFDECIFLDKTNLMKYNFKKSVSFRKCIFNNTVLLPIYGNQFKFKDCNFKRKNIILRKGNIDGTFQIINCKNISKINFFNTSFNNKFRLQKSIIEKDVSLKNVKFKDLADFYQTKFKKINFERTDFEKISVFSEVEFYCDVDFKYTKFFGKSIFRDTVILGELDLRNTIFNDEANFLDITSKSRKVFIKEKNEYDFKGEAVDIKVANRETARVIKNFYDNSNNNIEANRFYKLEMKERHKEFKNNSSTDYNSFEKFIFFIHWLSSNHSQNWLLSIFWIIVITFFFSYSSIQNFLMECKENPLTMECHSYENLIYFSLSPDLSLFLFYAIISVLFIGIPILVLLKVEGKKTFYTILLWLLLFGYLVYENFTNDYDLNYFSNILNPFSIMIGKDNLTSFLFIYKIVIAYLIYQLIVSIRQNTRRK